MGLGSAAAESAAAAAVAVVVMAAVVGGWWRLAWQWLPNGVRACGGGGSAGTTARPAGVARCRAPMAGWQRRSGSCGCRKQTEAENLRRRCDK